MPFASTSHGSSGNDIRHPHHSCNKADVPYTRVAESVHNTLPADHDQQNKLEGHEIYESSRNKINWKFGGSKTAITVHERLRCRRGQKREVNMSEKRDNIRFNTLRNALYHSARNKTLLAYTRFSNFLIVALGTSAAANIFTSSYLTTQYIAAVLAFIGTANLVFDFGNRANTHQMLQRDYYKLLSRIEETIEPDEEMLASWQSELVKITAMEPPTLRAVDAKAYNDAIDGLGVFEPQERLHIPFWHRIAGQVNYFEGYEYKKISGIS